jgi:ketosteroid isomerase-like protein
MESDQEKHVHAFYEALAPGHRERLFALQSAHVVYELPEGMPVGAGRFEGMLDLLDRFLPEFYGAFDARFLPEETIAQDDRVVVLGRLKGTTRQGGLPIDVPFVHVWTVADHVLTRMRGFLDTATLARALEAARGGGRVMTDQQLGQRLQLAEEVVRRVEDDALPPAALPAWERYRAQYPREDS